MASTDSPLKDLVESCIIDFASWLLDAEVIAAQPLNTELAGQPVRVDQLYLVTLADERRVRLHIEFQGVRTREPMPLRMLDYMTRQAKNERDSQQHSVVFYVGQGAGADDRGEHQIDGSDGQPVLTWRYQVIHLWKMKAEEIFAFKRPALVALVGQTQIDTPADVLPRAVHEIKEVADETLRERLLTDLVALIGDKEMIIMIEKLVEEEGLLMDTPFLRRIREQSRKEGFAEAQTEVARSARRRDILNILVWRFDPPASRYQQVEKTLVAITDDEPLTILLKAAAQAQTFEEFQTSLSHLLAQPHGDQTETAQP